MRSNSSPVFFHFTPFTDHGPLRYLFFCLCLIVYVTIVSANTVIFLTVCMEKSLHQPMFIFISCLSLNSLCGSAAFFPRFLMDVLSDSHVISQVSCFLQMYVIHSYKGQEITVLTLMAYDRFVAVLYPLHYHSRMTLKMVLRLLFLALLTPVSVFGFFFYFAVSLPLCGNQVHRIFCTIWSVVQLSCVETLVLDIMRQILVLIYIVIPLLFVLYTYLRILLVCSRSSAEFRGKTLQTCLPHIVTFVNYCISILCEVSLYKVGEVNTLAIVVLSLEFLIIPPITNPLFYGLNLPQVRRVIFRRVKICKTARTGTNSNKSDCHAT